MNDSHNLTIPFKSNDVIWYAYNRPAQINCCVIAKVDEKAIKGVYKC